jgi:hypothetical protein
VDTGDRGVSEAVRGLDEQDRLCVEGEDDSWIKGEEEEDRRSMAMATRENSGRRDSTPGREKHKSKVKGESLAEGDRCCAAKYFTFQMDSRTPRGVHAEGLRQKLQHRAVYLSAPKASTGKVRPIRLRGCPTSDW